MIDETKISVGIQGAFGKTGSLVLDALLEDSEVNVVAISSLRNSSHYGKKIQDITVKSLEETDIVPDVWIDFSTPEGSVSLVEHAANTGAKVLLATTGLNDSQLEIVKLNSNKIPILVAPNTSLGVFVLKELTMLATSLLGADYDIEVLELHHNKKKDAPSGTAITLLDSISKHRPNLTPVFDRTQVKDSRQSSNIGVSSIRGGDIVGEHTVYFVGQGERIEVSHKAWDRKIFGKGAVLLAKKLQKTALPGFYGLDRGFFLDN